MGGIGIRDARENDLAGLMRLEEASFPKDAWSEGTMRRALESPHSRMMVLEDVDAPSQILGYASVLAARGSGEADVETINIDPACRRGGWATRLLRELAGWASTRGAKELFLEVRANGEPAIRLYEKLGFVEIGRRANYYRAEGQDAIVMRARIDEVIARAEDALARAKAEAEAEASHREERATDVKEAAQA